MRSIVIVSLLLACIVGHNCYDDEEEFAKGCLKESKAWAQYVDFMGSENNKDKLFQDWYDANSARNVLGGRVGKGSCPNELDGQQVKVMEKQEALDYLCTQEKAYRHFLETCEDELLGRKINYAIKIFKAQRDRLQLLYSCPAVEVNVTQTKKPADKLKELYFRACEKSALYEFIVNTNRKIYLNFNYGISSSLTIDSELDDAKDMRTDFCHGPLEDCCGKELVDTARRNGHLEAAKIFVEVASQARDAKCHRKYLEFAMEAFKKDSGKKGSTVEAMKLIKDQLAGLK